MSLFKSILNTTFKKYGNYLLAYWSVILMRVIQILLKILFESDCIRLGIFILEVLLYLGNYHWNCLDNELLRNYLVEFIIN